MPVKVRRKARNSTDNVRTLAQIDNIFVDLGLREESKQVKLRQYFDDWMPLATEIATKHAEDELDEEYLASEDCYLEFKNEGGCRKLFSVEWGRSVPEGQINPLESLQNSWRQFRDHIDRRRRDAAPDNLKGIRTDNKIRSAKETVVSNGSDLVIIQWQHTVDEDTDMAGGTTREERGKSTVSATGSPRRDSSSTATNHDGDTGNKRRYLAPKVQGGESKDSSDDSAKSVAKKPRPPRRRGHNPGKKQGPVPHRSLDVVGSQTSVPTEEETSKGDAVTSESEVQRASPSSPGQASMLTEELRSAATMQPGGTETSVAGHSGEGSGSIVSGDADSSQSTISSASMAQQALEVLKRMQTGSNGR